MDEQIGIVTRGINNIYAVVSLDDVSRLATARTYS